MNTGAPGPDAEAAEQRVLEIQTKLHQWASHDPKRRFEDLYNLVTDPAFLAVAWKRVKSNRGARSAGVDGATARYITVVRGEDGAPRDTIKNTVRVPNSSSAVTSAASVRLASPGAGWP